MNPVFTNSMYAMLTLQNWEFCLNSKRYK